MGLSPLLVDTYHKYKKGTESFVRWLSITARGTGTVEDVFSAGLQEPVPAARGRLKGKARKEAKKVRLTANLPFYKVPINAFVKLAKAIVNNPSINVPRSVFTTLGAVIRGRKDCATWYLLNQSNADRTMKENNASHQHFIRVLEATLETLKTNKPRTTEALPDVDQFTTKLANMFESLEVEEPNETEDIPENVFMDKCDNEAEYFLESSDADVSFAAYCFLKDITHIRLFVRRTWLEFKHGDICLSAAALTMNAAIRMIEKLSDEFQEAFPRFRETNTERMHTKMLQFMYQGFCTQQEGSAFLQIEDEASDPFTYKENGQTLHSSTIMCTHTTDLLLRYFDNENDGSLRLSTDENLFIKSMSQLAALPMSMKAEGEPCQGDMVHKAIWNLVNNRQVTTSNVVATQIFWDTQRELGAMLPVAKDLLEKTGHELAHSYHNYFETPGLDRIGLIHKKFRGEMEARLKHVEAMAMGSRFQAFVNQCESRFPWKVYKPTFSLLECHPALCGLTLTNIRDEHHRTAINIAGCQGQILVAAHLYNAVQCSGLLPKDDCWADLEFFIDKQGSDWIFVGDRPQQGDEFVRHLNLVMGMSITKYAKDFKNPKTGNGSDGNYRIVGKIRHFEYLARYAELGCERLGNKYKKPSCERSTAGKDLLVMTNVLAKDYLSPETTDTSLSTIDILSAFKKAIEKDDHAYSFDVMDLYLRCLRLLHGIQMHCMKHAPGDFPKSVFNEGLKMNYVVTEMLNHYSGVPHHDKLMLPDAVAILKKIIKEEGSLVLDQAKAHQDTNKAQQTTVQAEAEPSFENPPEDMFGLDWRNMFGCIVFQDANGDCRMPFG